MSTDSCRHINELSVEISSLWDDLEKTRQKEEKNHLGRTGRSSNIISGLRKRFLVSKNANYRWKKLHSDINSNDSNNNVDSSSNYNAWVEESSHGASAAEIESNDLEEQREHRNRSTNEIELSSLKECKKCMLREKRETFSA